MEISHFGASIPQRSWHTSTWDAWYNWIFGKRVLSGTVEDNVLETTEGLRTKSVTPKSSNTTLVTKSKTPKSTNGARAVESDSPTSPNVAPATKNVIVSFLDCYFTAPFLASLLHFSTIAFLSWTYPLLYWVFLYWTFPWLNIPFWTVPLLNLPLMNYAFTVLFYYRTIPLLN